MSWGHRNSAGKLLLTLGCLSVIVAACARSESPAPVTYGSSSSSYKPGAAAQQAFASPGQHLVQRGDTLYGISSRYGVPLRSLIDANGLQPPYTLLVGQRLTIPQPKVHLVQGGDTVFSLSRRYSVSMTELSRANGLSEPYRIQVGQQLVIPAPGSSSTPPPAAGTSRSLPVPAAAPVPKAPASPEPAPLVASAAPPVPPAKPSVSAPAAATQQASLPSASKPEPLPEPPQSSGRFLWPLQGQVISGFGSKPGGLHNDGVNIAAPAGAPVKAAENGVIVYAGSELKGFGKLLLVKHDGGWVTAYAHNGRLLVGRGQTVTKGQQIALVGATGNVDRPQLHFELRKGKQAVDPAKHLPPLQAQLKN
jgi:murein DD-endopeptidase MepM/ murein hydrolase activator NlpD